VRTRGVAISLGLIVLAVVAQTAVFGEGGINPFGAAPAVVLVVVLACGRYVDPEPAILIGFTGGMLLDLLGGKPLGLWAMVYTVVVYVALRFRDRADDGPLVVAVGVLLLTLGANALFVVVGTLFGERFFTSTAVIKNTVLPALYNIPVAAAAFPLVSRLIGSRRRLGWSS
jgi:rod shape-determining protein MreD